MESFDIATVVGVLVKEFALPPDYSTLMEELATHENDFVRLHTLDSIAPVCPGAIPIPRMFKILFTTDEAIIVQELELTWGNSRFEVRKIDACEWDDYFVEWLTPEDEDYGYLGRSLWVDGMRMYGAEV
jgi:hypothetical protein